MVSHVDPKEIAKFDELGEQWWDLEGSFKPLHDINPLRTQFILDNTQLTDMKIIDVGCGGGILTESLAKHCSDTTGIDLSEQAIKTARNHAELNELTIKYQIIDIADMAEQHTSQFDVLTCMELLEHVPEPAEFINHCAKLVKPGGDLFFSTINRNLKSFLFAIVGAEYVLNLIPRGTHEYVKFIRPSELDGWLSATDCKLKAIAGIDYNPITKYYALSENVQINYLIHAVKHV